MKRDALAVRFYGTVSQNTGYGAAARAYIHALSRSGITVSVADLAPSTEVADPLVSTLLNRPDNPDLYLFHYYWPKAAIPLSLPLSRVVALITWETDTIPSVWIDTLNRMREVWVPCAYNVRAFRKALAVPVFKLPHALAPRSRYDENVLFPAPDLPGIKANDYVFYSVFVWQHRKYPEGAIEAYLRAFPKASNIVLILKVSRAPAQVDDIVKRLREHTGSTARVLVYGDTWSERQLDALAARGDCYVSLHRGEGWGYPLFDAACRGHAVVATAYSGPLEYLDRNKHCLVRYRLVAASEGAFCPPMKWAEPDLLHAALLLRYTFTHKNVTRALASEAANRIVHKYSLATVGNIAKRRLLWLTAQMINR